MKSFMTFLAFFFSFLVFGALSAPMQMKEVAAHKRSSYVHAITTTEFKHSRALLERERGGCDILCKIRNHLFGRKPEAPVEFEVKDWKRGENDILLPRREEVVLAERDRGCDILCKIHQKLFG